MGVLESAVEKDVCPSSPMVLLKSRLSDFSIMAVSGDLVRTPMGSDVSFGDRIPSIAYFCSYFDRPSKLL